MERFAILLAGPIDPTIRLRRSLSGRRIIAADGGIRHCAALGLTPELWIGDFDSTSRPMAERYRDVRRETLPRDKDHTDGELAIARAMEAGANDLLLVGALGGPRSDHAFSHLVLALRHAHQGRTVELFDGRQRAIPLGPRPVTLDCEPGAQFSVLKFSDIAGLTIRGARWPLTNVDLPFDSILTQSNEALGPVEISLAKGSALALVQVGPDRGE